MAFDSYLLVVMLEVPLEQSSLVKAPPEQCNLADLVMEKQDRLLQDYLLLLVGPSRVGRTHTGRIPQQSSPGGRKGSLGRKYTSPSILARPRWR